jgi:hypothetical protein
MMRWASGAIKKANTVSKIGGIEDEILAMSGVAFEEGEGSILNLHFLVLFFLLLCWLPLVRLAFKHTIISLDAQSLP